MRRYEIPDQPDEFQGFLDQTWKSVKEMHFDVRGPMRVRVLSGAEMITFSVEKLPLFHPRGRFDFVRKLGRDRRLCPSHRLLWRNLADRCGKESGTCFPAHATLARELGISRRHVIRLAQDLQRFGYLVIRHRPRVLASGESVLSSNIYHFAAPWNIEHHRTILLEADVLEGECLVIRIHNGPNSRTLSSEFVNPNTWEVHDQSGLIH